MEKITFVNDSEPYLSAETLNQLQENIEQATVIAGSTEPTNENVWFKRGKNLFDKNNANILNCYITMGTGVLTASDVYKTAYVKVKPNTTYTVSKTAGTEFRVSLFDSMPYIGATTTNQVRNAEATSITITTNSNTEYLIVTFAFTTNDNYNTMLNSLQIEQGDTATTYEEYVEKEIYVKNDNGVFERFYKEPKIKNAITVYKNGMQTMTASGEIQFDTINTRLGTQLNLENNKIIIGDDIDKIKVSAQLWYYVGIGTRQWFSIKKNGVTINQTIINVSSNYFTTAQLMPIIISVSKGDMINLELANFSNGEININNGATNYHTQTFLTIEEVK